MRIVQTLQHPLADVQGAAIALGNFDGVHRGHRVVIAAAIRAAADLGVPSAVLTFEPHPRSLFRPDAPPFRLTPLRTKVVHLRESGIDLLYLARFDRVFAAQTAEQFVRSVLVEGLAARHVVVGYDFVFGKDRGGDASLLENLSVEFGFGLTIVAPVAGADAKEPFASRKVRETLRAGEPAAAAAALGHWWEIAGRVRRGSARGHGLGYPTANLSLRGLLQPKFGIYAVHIRIAGDPEWRPGVASLGIRPMFEGGDPILEVHLFDFEGNLYGQPVCVALVAYLRPEATFESLNTLRAAMDEDVAAARTLLASSDAAPDRFAAA